MTEKSDDKFIKLPVWLVRLCKWSWNGRKFLYGTVILSIILNLVAALPLVDPSTLHTLPIAWLSSHWLLLLVIFVLLLLLTAVCGLIARLSAPLSERELRRRYLEQVARDTELTTLKGIPAGLISESVRLADIYIPPRFYANRTRVDFPVSDEDLERYRQSLKRGQFMPDLERVLFEAERNWHNVLRTGERVGLDVIWQQLSEGSGCDAVVIQGYAGMGKSTLMERLTLHMAARGLRQPDPDMPEREKLTPVLIPVLLRLGNYARALVDKADLTLTDYLLAQLKKMDLPGLTVCMDRHLLDGDCLVMLDGLDEVSELERRRKVQAAIRGLVSGSYHRCRFIITSRVAGYDQAAFPAYAHFILAELTDKEIEYFLPLWCRANLDRENRLRMPRVIGQGNGEKGKKKLARNLTEASIEKEVERRVKDLRAAIKDNQAVRNLAKNPLLLTLLLVMQQNSIVLPRQRVELYDKVTKTLLESRNLAKELETVSEFQAIERLGPLAFQMQEADSDLIHQSDVEKALRTAIRSEGGTEEQVGAEAERFLKRVRERGGIFVSRVGDYFGFMHRTFQEYFAARYILNNIKSTQTHWIGELVTRTRRQDALWREPFLLAVAYPTYNNNEPVANEILRALLTNADKNTPDQEEYVVLLAVNAIVEAKPLTIELALQIETAERMLACYERTQRERNFEVCNEIERAVQLWLSSLPKEAYRLPLLDVISQAIRNMMHVTHQRAALTLLAMITRWPESCPPIIYDVLIPSLLALTGLSAIGPYNPSADLAVSTDFDAADLALCVLSFMGKHGPAGLYLETMREYFTKRPEQLRLLARYSLECGTLITPTVEPYAKENYERYTDAIKQWFVLRDRPRRQITVPEVDECFTIQQTLLACTDGVNYPISLHLLAMLRRGEKYAEKSWSEVWQIYLLEQLDVGNCISYQEIALLWYALFPGAQLQPLVNVIVEHYSSYKNVRKRYAQRLLSYLAIYLRYLSMWRDLRGWRYLRYWQNIRHGMNLWCLRAWDELY
jgi:hypothetical protein